MFRIVPFKKKLNSDLNVDPILEDFAPEHAVRVVKVEQVGEARLRRKRPLLFAFPFCSAFIRTNFSPKLLMTNCIVTLHL